MPIIKVNSINAAAAIAGAVGSRAFPTVDINKPRKTTRSEKTTSRNPEMLTIKQHIFPAKSIERFYNSRGCVSVYDIIRNKKRETKASDIIFCSDRGWSHGIEKEMIKIENEFQGLCEKIISDERYVFTVEDKLHADRMHALWFIRSQFRHLETQEYFLNGVSGKNLTKAEEEKLEKKGFYFVRSGGGIPSRFVNGIQLMLMVGKKSKEYEKKVQKWSVIKSINETFIVPDVPFLGIIPITPNIAIISNHDGGYVEDENLLDINKDIIKRSVDYFFSKDLFFGKKDKEISSILFSIRS